MEAAYVTSKGQLVVPVRIRRKYGIKPGTKVFFIERGDQILFQPVTREFIRTVCGMLQSRTGVGEELLRERSSEAVAMEVELAKLRLLFDQLLRSLMTGELRASVQLDA